MLDNVNMPAFLAQATGFRPDQIPTPALLAAIQRMTQITVLYCVVVLLY